MQTVLDAPSMTAEAAAAVAPHQCPECGRAFALVDARQIFCCQAHRRSWNNRWTVRGAVIAPLAAVARMTRNGTRGRREVSAAGARAGRDLDHLLRRYQREDAEAGRMD